MKKIMDEGDEPVGALRKVQDFLPPPEALALPDETVKITISLNKSSVEFFKKIAKKNHTKYQRMIREILDRYASHYDAA